MTNSDIYGKVKTFLTNFIGIDENNISADTSVFDLGIDSVMMVSFVQEINERFGVNMTLNDLAFTYNTIDLLCNNIEENSSDTEDTIEESTYDKQPEFEESDSSNGYCEIDIHDEANSENAEVCKVIEQQNKIIASLFAEQLRAVQNRALGATDKMDKSKNRTDGLNQLEKKASVKALMKNESKKIENIKDEIELSIEQREYVRNLISELEEKTNGSKRIAQEFRKYLADLDEIAGFTMILKELHYQITEAYGKGAHLFDIDGNEYIDIAMGYGTIILGHTPDFVLNAIKAEVDKGIQLGARHRLVGEASKRLCSLTGFDRATFTVTGTEAVMTAMKIARAYTRKNKIVIFSNGYHGHSDATLVSKFKFDQENRPIAPGIDRNSSNDIIILKYDCIEDANKLYEIENLAAVLIEPVQSRFPERHPVEFLRRLREITEERNVLLIFDEIITGFRCNIGGAKALFNVEPDMATYGKAIGNGMPIAAVTGKAKIMDVTDGGQWTYGDKSFPDVEKTFYAGTYFKHPFSMAALDAILKHYEKDGKDMIESINQKTNYLVQRLNCVFEDNKVAIKVGNFASLFMFKSQLDNIVMNIFYYTLLSEGVYTWEGRTCFISSAHTDEDIEEIIKSVERTVKRMCKGGFFRSNIDDKFYKGICDETYYE